MTEQHTKLMSRGRLARRLCPTALAGFVAVIALGCNESPVAHVAPSLDAAGSHAMASIERAIAPTKADRQAPAAEISRHIAQTQHWEFELPAERIEAVWRAHSNACSDACEIVQARVSLNEAFAGNAFLELRIEHEALDAYVRAIEADGAPKGRSVIREDRTLEVVDLEARLENQRALAARLRELLAGRPGALKDLLAIERELMRVQADIDAMTAQRRVLAQQTEKVHLLIDYRAAPRTDFDDAWAPVREAWHGMALDFTQSLSAVMGFIATAAPWILFGLPIVLALMRFVRRPGNAFGRVKRWVGWFSKYSASGGKPERNPSQE